MYRSQKGVYEYKCIVNTIIFNLKLNNYFRDKINLKLVKLTFIQKLFEDVLWAILFNDKH